jgi:UPF0042 nucleotide-binding protein
VDREDFGAGRSVVLLSGLSGAGKTAGAKLFEDLGFTVVDNLPAELLPGLADLVASDPDRFARTVLVLDSRSGDAAVALGAARGALEGRGIRPTVVFLEASDETLVRRFSETRHRHPLAGDQGVEAAIVEERRRLDPVRTEADVVVDTSDGSLRDLRARLYAVTGTQVEREYLVVQLISFGYKHGIPLEADLLFDVRFMHNPYYVPALREHTGLEDVVREYVMAQPAAGAFLDWVRGFLEFALPAYEGEGKSRLTIGIGCTGGVHRSIVIADEIAGQLRAQGRDVAVYHRELARMGPR